MKRLPKAQDKMIFAWVLGGIDAIRRHSTRTVDALIKQGYIDKVGPTDKARSYVEARHNDLVAESYPDYPESFSG